MRVRLLAIALLLAAASADAQPPAYQPGIDVLDYTIAIELPDTGAFIRGDVIVTLRRSRNVDHLTLDLVDALMVRSVEVDGRAVTAPHTANKISVPLSGAAENVKVRVRYEGMVSDGLIARKDAKGRWTWFGDNWPNRARQWLPTVDHPSDKATVSWHVRMPLGRSVVANGLQVSTRPIAGQPRKVESIWKESRPIATYLMVIGAGPLERFPLTETVCHRTDEGPCALQSVWVMPENKTWLPGVFTTAGPIVSLFEKLVGPFPYEKLAHVQSSTRFGGMENASAIFYDGKLFDTQKMSDGLIAHETAHQWFGDAVTEREWGHLWLSEGFATYFAALWTLSSKGDAAYRAEMAAIRKQVLADKVVAERPVIDTAQTDYLALLNANSYQKGGYILYMLHQQMGDSAFFGGIRSYYARYRNGNALSDDLRAELEEASRLDLKPFFDQWLRRPGVAEPTIGWAYDASEGRISVRVLQQDARCISMAAAVVCEGNKTLPYALSLPIVITDATGTTVRLTVEIPADQRVTMPLPGRYARQPRAVAIDPDERLLARIARL
ncbi:MAG: putative family peptidase [Gemmatimonadetes bacterium]|nr:putative family peptidase [Gemmatimonadota bacterium]